MPKPSESPTILSTNHGTIKNAVTAFAPLSSSSTSNSDNLFNPESDHLFINSLNSCNSNHFNTDQSLSQTLNATIIISSQSLEPLSSSSSDAMPKPSESPTMLSTNHGTITNAVTAFAPLSSSSTSNQQSISNCHSSISQHDSLSSLPQAANGHDISLSTPSPEPLLGQFPRLPLSKFYTKSNSISSTSLQQLNLPNHCNTHVPPKPLYSSFFELSVSHDSCSSISYDPSSFHDSTVNVSSSSVGYSTTIPWIAPQHRLQIYNYSVPGYSNTYINPNTLKCLPPGSCLPPYNPHSTRVEPFSFRTAPNHRTQSYYFHCKYTTDFASNIASPDPMYSGYLDGWAYAKYIGKLYNDDEYACNGAWQIDYDDYIDMGSPSLIHAFTSSLSCSSSTTTISASKPQFIPTVMSFSDTILNQPALAITVDPLIILYDHVHNPDIDMIKQLFELDLGDTIDRLILKSYNGEKQGYFISSATTISNILYSIRQSKLFPNTRPTPLLVSSCSSNIPTSSTLPTNPLCFASSMTIPPILSQALFHITAIIQVIMFIIMTPFTIAVICSFFILASIITTTSPTLSATTTTPLLPQITHLSANATNKPLVSHPIIATITRVPIIACAFLLICLLILATLLGTLLDQCHHLLDNISVYLSSAIPSTPHATPVTSNTVSPTVMRRRNKSNRKRALLSQQCLDINKLSSSSVDLLLEDYLPPVIKTVRTHKSSIMNFIVLPGLLLENALELTFIVTIILSQLLILCTQCVINILLSPTIRTMCGLLKISIVSANSFSYEFCYNVISLLIRPSRKHTQSQVNEFHALSNDTQSLPSNIPVIAFANLRATSLRCHKKHKFLLPDSSSREVNFTNTVHYDNYARTDVLTSYRNCTQTRRSKLTQGYRIPTTVTAQNFRLCTYNKHETPKGRKSQRSQTHHPSIKHPSCTLPRVKPPLCTSPYRHLRCSQRRDILRRSNARASSLKFRTPMKNVDRHCKPHSPHCYYPIMHSCCYHHTQFTMRYNKHRYRTIPSPGHGATTAMDHQANHIIDHSCIVIPPHSMLFPLITIVSSHRNPFISLDSSSTPLHPSIT